MSFATSAMDIIAWLESAVDTTSGGKRIRERYNISQAAWINRYRSDCGIESAYAFLCAWQYTRDAKYLNLARELYAGIVAMQNGDGSFPYYAGVTRSYTNDNSEVAIFLLRMAEIDKANAGVYRAKALEVADYLLSIQNSDGSWQRSTTDAAKTALFTAHAVSALSMAYKFTGNKESYRSAVVLALDWIAGKILPSGRITLAGANETQRPPSSDQAVVVRAFAHAELYVADGSTPAAWRENRMKLLNWLTQLITAEGAIQNGLGEGANGADTINVADHVYTTAFAVEAFYCSYCVDGNMECWEMALRAVRFVQGNLYYSGTPAVNGVIRGVFNLKNRDWDTSEAALDSSEQGGGNMVYTGWTNAPLAALLFAFDAYVSSDKALSYRLGGATNRIVDANTGRLRVYADGATVQFPVCGANSVRATPVRLCENGTILTLANPL